MRSWPLGFVALGLVLSCWTVALRSWASALRKSSASGSDVLRRLGLSIGIAAHRHFCTSERRYDGTTVRRNDARDGGRFSAPLRASSIYICALFPLWTCPAYPVHDPRPEVNAHTHFTIMLLFFSFGPPPGLPRNAPQLHRQPTTF